MTRETVVVPTPAFRATWLRVGCELFFIRFRELGEDCAAHQVYALQIALRNSLFSAFRIAIYVIGRVRNRAEFTVRNGWHRDKGSRGALGRNQAAVGRQILFEPIHFFARIHYSGSDSTRRLPAADFANIESDSFKTL
jgi:hypothetical protein